ncbi:heat shock 70 kDa protein 12A-like isoform X1 [Pocillopora verrucosa]|uniref:heat shock 70 kDa protein 12A-like isoform X1 n=2 Tax=Pocillopora verrucosa TaxID=203993 RepID=UPI00333FE33F
MANLHSHSDHVTSLSTRFSHFPNFAADPGQENYDVVVAIDFGTSFSGFAFSFNHKDGSDEIYMNREWGSAQGYSTLKTPTCLLLNPYKKFIKFGFEAAEKYAELEDAKDKSFYCFDRFKMMLHGSEGTLNRNSLLSARNGKPMRALEIFSKALGFLKDKALQRIHQQSGVEYTAREVRWVVTVPAIWKQSAKQFMREAAYEAGLSSSIDSSQVIIALEPEAAAVYCRDRKLREFVEGNGDQVVKDTLVPAKTQYLVIDNGGGTMDITAHEIEEGDTINEIFHATGGDYGGTKVDKEFEDHLDKIFGKIFMDEFRRAHPSDWLELMNDFEVKKRSDRVMTGEITRIRLPANFINLLRHESAANYNAIIKKHLGKDYDDKEVKISKDYLCLGPRTMKSLFQPAIASIVDHLKGLLKKKELREVKLLFLVGGFSESPLLQARIREVFNGKYNILIPNDAQTAVVKGAVMFGKRPDIVVERCLSETYGTDIYQDFITGYHDMNKLVLVEGVPKCKDIFSILAKENEKVKIGHYKETFKYKPVRSSQTKIGFNFFTSRSPNVRYITDAGVRKLPGCFSVVSPDTSKGTNRSIELRLYFGTELKVVGVDLETGNEASTYIDFLSQVV